MPQRASLFTAMQRALTKDTIVIVDGLNYIKGYRYQMYCVARELSVRVATVSRPTCAIGHLRQGNKMRNSYSQPVGLHRCHTGIMPRMACATPPGAGVHAFDVSSTRIHQPHVPFIVRCNRFDNLIQRFEEPSSMVRWDSPLFTVPWNEEPPVNDIWKAITGGVVKPPNAGTTAVR